MKVNKKRLQGVFLSALFVVIMILIGILMYLKLDTLSSNFTKSQLKIQSDLVSRVVFEQFKNEIESLDFIRNTINPDGSNIEKIKQANGLDDDIIGLLRLDGSIVYGPSVDLKKYYEIKKSFRGDFSVSFCQNEGLLFSVPVFNGKNVKYVLYKFVPVEKMKGYFNLDLYDGNCKVAVLTKSMDLIYTDIEKFEEVISDKELSSSIKKMKKALGVSSNAAELSKLDGKYCFIFASEIPYTDFIVSGIIPYKMASDGIDGIAVLFMSVFVLMFLLFIGCLIFVISEERYVSDTKQLEEEKKAAEQANVAKSDFLANMSHEIRTPINSILGMNEMILRECEDSVIRSYAQDIYSAGHGLLALINDILDFSKIEAGKMDIVPAVYELASLLNDITNMIGGRARSKHLDFIVDVDTNLPSRLKGDSVRIQQILINLLNNAVKYTNEGFIRLIVKQSSWNKDNMILHIEVQDSGIGIKEENINKLFNSFTRFDLNRNRNIEGSGLGLAITQRLVNCMNGKISVQSKYGEGSTFTVEIPQQIVDFNPVGNFKERFEKFKLSQQKHKELFTAPNARILVVDDNAMNLHVAKSLLKQTLIQVSLCSSGMECIEILKKERFDIIFLDHMMPIMDGIETLNAIKKMENNLSPDCPIIALTANAIAGVKEMYLKAGFTDYISKPIEGRVFEELIRSYLPAEKVIPVDEALVKNIKKVEAKAEPQFVQQKNPVDDVIPPEEESDELIDEKKGLVYCGNDMDTYREIVQVYVAESIENMQKLEKFLTEGDLKNYSIVAHAVKSTSLTIGAVKLSEKAKAQEFAGKEDRADDLKNAHAEFIELYNQTVACAREKL